MNKLQAFTAQQATPTLIDGLLLAELKLTAGGLADEDQRAYRLTRATLIAELERRHPAADAAVQAAFEAWDVAHANGEGPAGVDYVAVLLAAIEQFPA